MRTPLLLLFAVSMAPAQITGDLRGTVSDPSGAGVPAAKVTVVSIETGERRQSSSDREGRYAFPLLKIGRYRIEAEAQGFRIAAAHTEVRSAEAATVPLRLEVGPVNEQVAVNEIVSLLDLQSGQTGESLEAKKVQEIPVARNPNALAATLPGIVPPPGGFNSGSFIANGNRARANNIVIDGITATDVSTAGTGSGNNGPLNFSSIREVKILTNAFSAEFGRNSGAQVQYLTKSGTNDFHGELYEYFRNDVLNSRDFFDTSGSAAKTRFHQFGGVFGGPVLRNRTHFFLAVEGAVVGGLGGTRIAQVPTASMLAAVTDPTSRRLLEQYRLPAAQQDLGSFGTVEQISPNTTGFYQWSTRIDHQLSRRDNLWGRVGVSNQDGTAPALTFSNNTSLANFGMRSVNKVYSVNLNETHVFSPAMVNEFRSGFGRTTPIFSIDSTVPIGPRIQFANGQVAAFGTTDSAPQGRVQNTCQVGDTLTVIRGAHSIKAGGDYFRYQLNSFQDTQMRGTYSFLNWDDFAAGRPASFVQRLGGTNRGHRTSMGGLFVQDDYRLTSRLTLNLGFRLEMFGRIHEVNRLTSNLDFRCRTPLGIAGTGAFGCFTVGEDIAPRSWYAQPRFGFAWNPRGGKTVIRGGYGLLADFNYLNPVVNQRALIPYNVNVQLAGIPQFTGGNTWANLVAGTAPIQAQGLTQVGVIRQDALNYGDVNPVIDAGLGNPQVHSWNFGVQRELMDRMVLKLSYVGTKANYLQRHRQLNLNANPPAPAVSLADEQARLAQFTASFAGLTGSPARPSARLDPRFNVVNLYDNSANSNFHAFELFLNRGFRAGYSLQVAYTWSKSIDDISDGLSALPNDSATTQDPRNLRGNRGLSGFDLPHRIVVSHVWELPFGRSMQHPVLRRLVRGWGFAGISSWRSGFPVSFESGPKLGIPHIGLLSTTGIMRPDALGPVDFEPRPAGSAGAPLGLNTDPVATRRISNYAESLGLRQPLLGNFGTLGRNGNRLNGMAQMDWNVYKNLPLTERTQLTLRCEMYNAFNHHAFQDANRNISNPGFGQYTSMAQSQRIFQLGAVVQF